MDVGNAWKERMVGALAGAPGVGATVVIVAVTGRANTPAESTA